MLTDEDFLTVLNSTPLVSIDLLLPNRQGQLLMGWRVNEPAAGCWFVPGGRIRKGESLEDAFRRLTEIELGVTYTIDQAKLVGAFTHIYPTNYLQVEGTSTHYVALGYYLGVDIEWQMLPEDQHSQYRWIGPDDDLANVHPNSAAYFDY